MAEHMYSMIFFIYFWKYFFKRSLNFPLLLSFQDISINPVHSHII